MKKIAFLLQGDAKNILRDPMLIMSILSPIILTLLLRYVLPPMQRIILRRFDVNLFDYDILIMSFAIILCPLMIGMLTGFLLLDERDEALISYFSITPLTRNGYLLYRISIPFCITLCSSSLLLLSSGVAQPGFWPAVSIVILTSLQAPIVTLFLGVFATNKVEGLALSKMAGITVIAPVIAYFVPSQLQYISSFLPAFWVTKAYMRASDFDTVYWLSSITGFVVCLLLVGILCQRFRKQLI
jgi:fluoroquinolone transport system permease protein